MIAVGIDLVEIVRISESITRNKNFVARFFGEDEQVLFSTRGMQQGYIQTVAANFAAKEAFSKALGTGIVGFALKDVEILRDERGAPFFKLSNRALEMVLKRNGVLSVSLSHTDNYATAVVILESNL